MGKPVRPGGEEGGGRGKDRAVGGGEDRRQTPAPPDASLPSQGGTAPPPGQGHANRGARPRERARQDGFASTAPSRFSQSRGGVGPARVVAVAVRRGLEHCPALGPAPRRPRESVSVLPRRHHPTRDPVACFRRAAQTKIGSIGCQGQGGQSELTWTGSGCCGGSSQGWSG